MLTISLCKFGDKPVASLGDCVLSNMARRGSRYTQGPTTTAATCVGGSMRLKGNFILATVEEVQSPEFWSQHKNVGGIVNCLRAGERPFYPHAATSQCEMVSVDVRDRNRRKSDLERAIPIVGRILEGGEDVVVHCRESFHRGPIVEAGLLQGLTGVDFMVA